VGEIGFPRREFLHDIKWWEVRSIIRGYNARHHVGWEQARLVAYNARFCMGSKDPIPTVTDWIRFPWEKEPATPISEDEVRQLQSEMEAFNNERATD
jgi:hypothetical protein